MAQSKSPVNRGTITSVKQIKPEWDFQDIVKYNNIKTTVGRVLFNDCLPASYPFINEPITKSKLYEILSNILAKYPKTTYLNTLDKLKRLGFKAYTLKPLSFPIDNLIIPKQLEKRCNDLLKIDDPQEFDKQLQSLIKDLKNVLDKQGYDVTDIVNSGGRGSWKQLAQILIAKGIVIDPKGNILPPIKSSFSAGLKPVEHFYQGAGARSGIIDRALSTAPVGYLTRKLVLATQSVILSDRVQDCKTDRYIQLKITEENAPLIVGRYTKSGRLITDKNYKGFIGKVIELRSPIYCKSPQICKICYGRLADLIQTNYIGIIAAQTIGERGLQVTMRTFHTGGVVSYKQIDIYEEIQKNNINITDKDITLIKKFIRQDNTQILSTANVPFRIRLYKSDYPIVGSLNLDKDTGLIYCSSCLICSLIFNNITITTNGNKRKTIPELVLDNITIMQPVQFKIPYTTEEVDYFEYDIETPNTTIFELRQSVDSFSQGIASIQSIFDAKVPFKTPEQFLLTLWSKYKDDAKDVDLVHYEVIISNLLRDEHNPSIPARLAVTWSPKQYPIKQIPFIDGSTWLLGLAFENAGKAIETGITHPQVSQRPLTPIERVLLGDI